jgi:hypothetical protein
MKKNLYPIGIYSLLILWIGRQVFLSPMTSTLGFLGTDSLDTMALRGLFFEPYLRFWPSGFSVLQLTPNLLDHITATPLVWIFGFPLGDNLWWFLILLANAVCGHVLGQHIGGKWGGYVAGIAIITSEQLLREVNLHHAPQSMFFLPLLYLLFLLRLPIGVKRDAILAGVFLGTTALSYLFYLPFMVIATIPWLWQHKDQAIRIILPIAALITLPNIVFLLTIASPMIATPNTGDIGGTPMLEAHSASPWFFLKSPTMDTSNIVSITLLFAATFAINFSKWWWMILFGSVMVLGTGGAEFLLPFDWMHSIPGMSRFAWPERWGMIILIGLIGLAAQAPQKIWIVLFLIIEMECRAQNLPIHGESTMSYRCYEQLQQVQGPILELPIEKNDLLYNRSALYQRVHNQPMVNPIILPPHILAPLEWEQWLKQPWLQHLDDINYRLSQSDFDSLKNSGIAAVIIDKSSFSPTTEGQANRWRMHLNPLLGKETNVGCFWIWPIKSNEWTWKRQSTGHQRVSVPLLMDPINKK